MACTCQEQWGDRYPVATACIGRVWLFDELPAPERAALVAAASRTLYRKGAAIFREGQPAAQMFLIKAGRVKLSKLSAAGTDLTLEYRKAGDFLGETVLHTDAEYPLTATCTEDTITCGFTKAGSSPWCSGIRTSGYRSSATSASGWGSSRSGSRASPARASPSACTRVS